jgi:hypothetical protein
MQQAEILTLREVLKAIGSPSFSEEIEEHFIFNEEVSARSKILRIIDDLFSFSQITWEQAADLYTLLNMDPEMASRHRASVSSFAHRVQLLH